MKVEEAEPRAAICRTSDGPRRFAADLVVLAAGRRPVRNLAESVRKLAKEVYVVGDCVTPGKIKDAVWEAFKLAVIV